jgi:hypothetical protein
MSETRNRPPQLLEWDLSRSHGVSELGWPERGGSQQFWKGDLRLTLKLPARVLRLELADARVEREGDSIHVIQLRSHPLTLEQAVAEVERQMSELELPRRDLEQWRADVASGDFRKDRSFATRRNDVTPALSLEVKHSYDEERPWYLSWEITWPTLVGPAARPS